MNSLKAVSILVILFMSLLLFAQTNTSSLKLEPTEAEKRADRYHITMGLQEGSNLYKEESTDRDMETQLELIPSAYLGRGFTLSADTIITRQEAGSGKLGASNTDLSNTKIILTKEGPAINRDWGTAFLMGGTAPTNQENRDQESYQGGASLGAKLSGQIKYVAITYTISGTRNFHGYTLTADGDPNVQYVLGHKLTIDYEFIEKWTLSFIGAYKDGWTYKNFDHQSYTNEIDLGRQIGKYWTLSAGISNEGGAFKANGTESNIKVYDQNTTVVQAAVTFTN
jgi:hypothetical protein